MNGEALVRKAQRGDAASREDLARAWLPRVYGAALARTRDAATAEDLTQEAFYRAFRKLDGLKDPARFGPWVLQIVRNAARDLHRRERGTQQLDDAAQRLAAEADTDVAASRETLAAWRALPEDERLVCWLKIVDGLAFRDIGELLGVSKSAVYRTYVKGLARMRKEMARC